MRGTSAALRPTLAFGWVIAACMSSSVAWAQLPSGQFLASGLRADPAADAALAVGTAWDPDGPGGAQELLVVAGPITRMGNVPMTRVGVFNGTTWSPLGSNAGALPSVPAQLLDVGGQLLARHVLVPGRRDALGALGRFCVGRAQCGTSPSGHRGVRRLPGIALWRWCVGRLAV